MATAGGHKASSRQAGPVPVWHLELPASRESSRMGHPSFHGLHYLLYCFLFSWQLICQSK